MAAIPPTNNTGLIVDEFIRYATVHLSTISGVATTVSLYPPLATPGPGIVIWTGYTVPPAKPSTPIPPDINQLTPEQKTETIETQKEIVQEDIRNVENISESSGDVEVKYAAKEFVDNAKERLEINEVVTTENEIKEELKKEKTDKKYNKNTNLDLIEKALIKIGITDKAIIKAVKANALKETGGQPIKENLNYGKTSNDRIRSIFGQRAERYNDVELNNIKKDPTKMGELMYGPKAGKIGLWLGNTENGDGYKFCGRGFIQITGKANYTACSLYMYKNTSLLKNPDLLSTPEGAADSTAWFVNRSLNTFSKKMGIAKQGASQSDANLLVTSIIAGTPIRRNTGTYLSSIVTKVDGFSSQLA